jgi:hypothetical protein
MGCKFGHGTRIFNILGRLAIENGHSPLEIPFHEKILELRNWNGIFLFNSGIHGTEFLASLI